MSRDESAFLQFLLIMVVGTLAILGGGIILSLWTLIKGWDNTGLFIKGGAIVFGFIPLFLMITNSGVGIDAQQTLYGYGAPLLSYGLLLIAYLRRDKMFRV